MKTFLVALALIVVVQAGALSEEQKKKLQLYTKECRAVSNVDEAVLKDLEKKVYADDPKLKVHALCIAKKMKVLTEKNDLDVELIREKLTNQVKDKAEAERILKLCDVNLGKNEDTAFETFKCLHLNCPEQVVFL